MRLSSRPVIAALAAAIVIASTGCRPDDEIRAYTAPKPLPPPSTPAELTTPTTPTGDKYRMLGAIIPADGKYSWFVKFVGTSEVVSPLKDDFNAFVNSIKAGNDSNVPPTFSIPNGWESVPITGMQSRIVSLKKGDAEMYLSNPFAGSLLENVNRWRSDDFGLRKLTQAELKDAVMEVKLGDKMAYTVDLQSGSWRGAKK